MNSNGQIRAISKILKTRTRRVIEAIEKHPMPMFLGLLAAMLITTALGSWLRRPDAPVVSSEPTPIPVEIFLQGEQPRISLTGVVEKTGVITLSAQTPGVIQTVHLSQGATVTRGSRIVSISSNYLGGNAASVARAISEKNAQFSSDTLNDQLLIIEAQRENIRQAKEQTGTLKDINRQTLDNNRRLVDIQRQLLSSLDAQLETLTTTNVSGSNNAAIEQATSAKAGLMAGIFQLEASIKQLELQTDDDGPVQAIARISSDSTLKQLDTQERSLKLGNDIAQLNLKLSRLSEASFYPASPVKGVVERIYVRPGQSINPGTPIALIRANEQSGQIVVSLPSTLGKQLSQIEPAIAMIDGEEVWMSLETVTTEPTQGSLVSAIYRIPETALTEITDGQFIELSVAIGTRQLSNEITIPLKAVYQTQDQSFVYVVSEGKAMVKTVTLGRVVGEYVTVTNGIESSDQVIITRGVTQGDSVVEN